MRQLKSFNVFQTAKTLGALYFVFGLIFGVIGFLLSLIHGRVIHALLILILPPIGYGVGGFIFTAIMCAIYNEIATRIGGIEFDLS